MSSFTGIKFNRSNLWTVVEKLRTLYEDNHLLYEMIRNTDDPYELVYRGLTDMLINESNAFVLFQIFDLDASNECIGRMREPDYFFENSVSEFVSENEHIQEITWQDTCVDSDTYMQYEEIIDEVDEKIRHSNYMLIPLVNQNTLIRYRTGT